MPITGPGSNDHTDDLRLAHVLADDADALTTSRFKSLDLHVMTKPDLTPVTDADQDPAAGTGLVCEPNPASLLDALHRALALFADPLRLAAVRERGMRRDFSWRTAVAAYERLYQDAL